MTDRASAAPWHLWVVGIASLAWNGFGGYDYYMTQIGSRDYLAAMSEPYGLSVDTAIAYYESFPIWVETAWAIAIWGSVLGALLLLMRSSFAYPAFAVSLLGMVLAMGWQFANPMPGMAGNALAWIMPAVVCVILLAEIGYARAMGRARVLT